VQDEEKMREDSPAIVDCVCILKNCKNGWEEKTGNRFMGVEGLGTTNQKRIGTGMRSRKGSLGQDWLVCGAMRRESKDQTWKTRANMFENERGSKKTTEDHGGRVSG
jgi:hypothetical protein